jgi:hypothetical protein
MRKFVCDICGVEVPQYHLNTLYDWYQQTGIEDVCDDCNKKIKDVINKIDDAIKPVKHHWVRDFIKKLCQT